MTNVEIVKILDSITERKMPMKQQKELRKMGIKYASGATKGVLIFPDCNFVIKWGFHSRNDESAQEAYIYAEAQKRGIEQIFLPTTPYYLNKSGISFFKQTKITSSSYSTPREAMREYRRKSREVKNSVLRKVEDGMRTSPDDYIWTRRAIQIYGKKFMREFEAFTHEFRINDLHEENTGYLKKRPVLLDFSGYHGEVSYTCHSSEKYLTIDNFY